MTAPYTFPVFLFERRRELEIENPDFELAGTLRFNTFGRRSPTRRQQLELREIIRGLIHDARSGRIKPGGVVIGWPGAGLKPLNAVDTSDEEAMAWWFARAFRVAVRVDAEAMTSAADELIFADQEIGHAQD